jgi:hypothetical protein
MIFCSMILCKDCKGQSAVELWSMLVQERTEKMDFRSFAAQNPNWKVNASKPSLKVAVPALDRLETALLPWGEDQALVDQCMQVLFDSNYHCAQVIGVLHGRYGPFIEQALASASLPSSFQWLAATTSAFNTGFDQNEVAGMWGMNSDIGRGYGLLSVNGIDQRKLPEESTHAFVFELERLQRRFPNDPHRVLVAYWKGMAYATRWTGKPGYDDALDEQLTLLKVLSRFMINIERPSFKLDWIEQAQKWTLLKCDGEGIDRNTIIQEGIASEQTLTEILPWWNSGFLTCEDAEKYGARMPGMPGIRPKETKPSSTQSIDSSPSITMPDASIENAIPCILYKVKKGDTLWNIAQRYPGNTPEELAEINAISDYIRIGQTLCVPDKK